MHHGLPASCLQHEYCEIIRVTSYLATDVFLRRDDLVHVGSQSGVQRDSLDLAGFHQSVVLVGGLTQHLSVYRIRNLEGRVVQEHLLRTR